jgi:hypothetical protein
MLLRRVREHVTAHNWFAVSVDLIIVVLGVFLGIQVSNWNAERLAHQAGEAYRVRIIRDVEMNENDMQNRAVYYGQVRAFALQVLGDLDGGARLPDDRFLIAAHQATQIFTRPMIRSAYEEILASGAYDMVGDADTRDRITSYYLTVDASAIMYASATSYRDAVRRAMPCRVQERFRIDCPETSADGAVGMRLSLAEQSALEGLDRAELARAAARVRATPGLELDVTRLLADIDQKLIQTAPMEQRANVLIDELRRP